ncbi:hypothetical protein BT69DRAFT_1276733 [Atractiella rhizophila]|nr:hypothetical protein BT69DRAFT_1276733 [Atractiella rhizophila]
MVSVQVTIKISKEASKTPSRSSNLLQTISSIFQHVTGGENQVLNWKLPFRTASFESQLSFDARFPSSASAQKPFISQSQNVQTSNRSIGLTPRLSMAAKQARKNNLRLRSPKQPLLPPPLPQALVSQPHTAFTITAHPTPAVNLTALSMAAKQARRQALRMI